MVSKKNATLQGLHSTPTATVHSCRLQLGGMEGFEDVFALLANLRAFNRDVRVCVARDVCPPLLFSLSLFFFTEKILAVNVSRACPPALTWACVTSHENNAVWFTLPPRSVHCGTTKQQRG